MTPAQFKFASDDEKLLCDIVASNFDEFREYIKNPTLSKKDKKLVATVKRIKGTIGDTTWVIVKEPFTGIRVGCKLTGFNNNGYVDELKKHLHFIGV